MRVLHRGIIARNAVSLAAPDVSALRLLWKLFRARLTRAIRVVARRCDRRDSAERLDTMDRALFLDDRVNQRVSQLSYRRGRLAVAITRTRLAQDVFRRFSSQFSRSSAASRSGSALVGPDRSRASSPAF